MTKTIALNLSVFLLSLGIICMWISLIIYEQANDPYTILMIDGIAEFLMYSIIIIHLSFKLNNDELASSF